MSALSYEQELVEDMDISDGASDMHQQESDDEQLEGDDAEAQALIDALSIFDEMVEDNEEEAAVAPAEDQAVDGPPEDDLSFSDMQMWTKILSITNDICTCMPQPYMRAKTEC